MYTDTSVKSKLIISKVSSADSGRYVCVAENSLGKHEAAMELEIKGKKVQIESVVFRRFLSALRLLKISFAVLGSPPDDLSCNVTTPNSVRLRWTDLNANNLMNDFIQGYILTYSKMVPADDLISEFFCSCIPHSTWNTITNLIFYLPTWYSVIINIPPPPLVHQSNNKIYFQLIAFYYLLSNYFQLIKLRGFECEHYYPIIVFNTHSLPYCLYYTPCYTNQCNIILVAEKIISVVYRMKYPILYFETFWLIRRYFNTRPFKPSVNSLTFRNFITM